MDELKPEDLARALVGLQEWASSVPLAPSQDGLSEQLRSHLGGDAKGYPVVSRALEGYQRANFQVAIDRFLEDPARKAELIGLPESRGYRMGLAELVRGSDSRWGPDPSEIGPVEYEPLDIGDRRIMCVAAGLWLIGDGEDSYLLMLRRSDEGPRQAGLGIEIMASRRETAEAVLEELERLMRELNPYSGQVLVLSSSPFGGVGVEVQPLPPVTREQIVFPDGVLERIERHTKTFSDHAEQLLAAGRHLKRGLLLHGPPGTGKTLTVMYLSRLMPGRTTLLLTGTALGAVAPACEMARELAPSMLVMEDVDLVAENRMRRTADDGSVRAAQPARRPQRGRGRDLRADDQPPGGDRAGARIEARADRPGAEDAAPRRPGKGSPAGPLRQGIAARARRRSPLHRGHRRVHAGFHPRGPAPGGVACDRAGPGEHDRRRAPDRAPSTSCARTPTS